ncbi:MAG: Txe/YoeB family addiction module toxin [Mariprofundus sp.]|nr:Txe/YoeB family addiction module toxin [Mariprofundus sp.]
MRNLAWTNAAWSDYIYWQGQDKKTLRRINKLIDDTRRSPFSGIGRPESLKENLAGFWSRRIDELFVAFPLRPNFSLELRCMEPP